MNILTIDIETSPNLADVWGLWQQNVSLKQLRETTEMLSFAAKWMGKKRVIFKSQYHHGRELMVQEAWKLLSEADVVMGWNSDKFDIRHINREFMEHGLGPARPFKKLDLMKVCRRAFALPSYKLDYVAGVLLGEHKLSTGGHELWQQCMRGERKAWAKMKEYNVRDTEITERLYEPLAPWAGNLHPNRNLWATEDAKVCHVCGSDHIVKDGFYYTTVSKYQQYRCQGCGAWGRGKETLARVDNRGIAL